MRGNVVEEGTVHLVYLKTYHTRYSDEYISELRIALEIGGASKNHLTDSAF